MDLTYIYIAIYLLILLLTGVILYQLIKRLGEIDLLGFKILIVSMSGIALFSTVSIIDYFTEYTIIIDGKPLYINDFIMVFSITIAYLSLFYLIEVTQKDRLTWRILLAIFFAGGSVVAEMLEQNLLSYILSASFEVAAMALLIYAIYDYAMELKPHVVHFKYYLIGLSGLTLLALAITVGAISQLLFVATKGYVYSVVSEMSAGLALLGLNLVIYPVILRPLSVFAIIAKPKAFMIITKEGDPLYEYYFDRNLSSIERKNLRDLLIGVYITVKNMLEEDTFIKYVETSKFSIMGSVYENTVALFLTMKSTIILYDILKTLHGIFEKELSETIKGENYESIDIEKLAHFDYVVKYYLTQLAR